jgi:hypothetical protein
VLVAPPVLVAPDPPPSFSEEPVELFVSPLQPTASAATRIPTPPRSEAFMSPIICLGHANRKGYGSAPTRAPKTRETGAATQNAYVDPIVA